MADPERDNDLARIRAGIDATNRGDFEALLALFDPNVEFHIAPGLGNAGTYRGHEASDREWEGGSRPGTTSPSTRRSSSRWRSVTSSRTFANPAAGTGAASRSRCGSATCGSSATAGDSVPRRSEPRCGARGGTRREPRADVSAAPRKQPSCIAEFLALPVALVAAVILALITYLRRRQPSETGPAIPH
jgi:SnoaL-like domain